MAAPALRLVLTQAGIARFTAAQLGQPIDLTLAKVGLSAAVVALAPTLVALPGEFRRIDTLSGRQVGRDVAHLIVRDEAALAYEVRAIGLFLADGTLFAVHAQREPIVGKSIVSTLLLALDIAFPADSTAAIAFGSTDFLNPPATEETKGVLKLATAAEAEAGTAGALAVTASRLKALLDPIRAAAAATENAVTLIAASLGALLVRRIVGGGLVTGGGDLSAERTLTVAAASVQDVLDHADATKAVTPASLVGVFEEIGNRVPVSAEVRGGGLATGGGTFSDGDILEIVVIPATGAETRAGARDDVAATPAALKQAGAIFVVQQLLQENGGYRVWSDGLKEAWGLVAVPANATANIAMPIAFTSWIVPAGALGSTSGNDQLMGVVNVTLAGFGVRNNNQAASRFYWHAKGV